MPHLLRETPRALARARLAVLVSTKASGRRKARAIACGEALLRLMERAVMIRWGQRLHEAAEHSAAHLKDGALRAAAVIQGCVERGMVVASLDASRAFDSVAHTAVLAALKAAGLPAEFVRFVMDTLEAREYAVAGTRIVPPRGRGTAQGTALGPSLFALTCERAAAAAERAVPGALIITYLDNVYVAAWKREDVERAVKEVVEQWERDGLRRGECFAVNAQVEGLPAAGADARLLGVGLDGHAPERYARARALAQKASKLSALAELIVIRDCAVAEVVYDQRAGGDMAELRGLHEELVEQLRLRAGLPARMAGTISRPARRRGLGVRPLADTRDAAVLQAGLAMLVSAHSLRERCWEMVRGRPAGAFFRLLVAVAGRAGYALDCDKCTIMRGGKLVVRAPDTIERAARDLAGRVEGERDGAAGGGGDRLLGAVGVLLCDRGPKPRLTDDEYRAAVALHSGYGGESVGEECELCGKNERHGHHRWCQGLQVEPGLEHDKVRDGIVAWMAEAAPVQARRERTLGPGVRADVEVSAPAGGLVEVEIKTVDMRCEAHEGKTLAKVASKLADGVVQHYGQRGVSVLVMDAAGNMTRASRATVTRLSAMGTTEGVERVPLMAVIGKACAAAEAASAGAYEAERDAWVTARRLVEQGGEPAARRGARRDASDGSGAETGVGGSSAEAGPERAAGTRWGAVESADECHCAERADAGESEDGMGSAEAMSDAGWRGEVEARIEAAGVAAGSVLCAHGESHPKTVWEKGPGRDGTRAGESRCGGKQAGAGSERGTATLGAFASRAVIAEASGAVCGTVTQPRVQ